MSKSRSLTTKPETVACPVPGCEHILTFEDHPTDPGRLVARCKCRRGHPPVVEKDKTSASADEVVVEEEANKEVNNG
jgi:hypothetical protein